MVRISGRQSDFIVCSLLMFCAGNYHSSSAMFVQNITITYSAHRAAADVAHLELKHRDCEDNSAVTPGGAYANCLLSVSSNATNLIGTCVRPPRHYVRIGTPQ